MKKFLLLLVTVVLFLFAGTPLARAATIHVPADYATIQAAITAANPYDIIEVAAGTYAEQITINKALTINGSDGAVLDGSIWTTGWTTGVKIKSGNVTFNNIDVTNYRQDGIICGYEASIPGNLQNIHITNCKVSNIQPGNWGFGIYVGYESEGFGYTPPKLTAHLDYSGLLIENNEITNTASSALVLQSITASSGTLQVLNNNIHDNFTNDGIWIECARKINIENNIIDGNLWGIEFTAYAESWYTLNGPYSAKDITISGNEIKDNIEDGFAIYNGWPATISITENIISGNTPNAKNYLAETLNANLNWWGSNVPATVTTGISTYVDFTPYLNSGTDISTDPGFQPDLSNLWVDANSPQTGTTGRIQEGINFVSGSTVNVAAGTYTEPAQVVINKNITMVGENETTTFINPGFNTTNSGDSRGFILVQPGFTFNLSNVTVDGTGKLVSIGILSNGAGTISNCIIKNIRYAQYVGRGIAFYDANMTINSNELSNIERIGIYMYGASVTNGQVTGNSYVGKGGGDWLDYGVEVEGGAHATITGNTFTDCGTSTSGWGSAGVLATTYFATGTQAYIADNTFEDNEIAVAVGYDETDVTSVTAFHNKFLGTGTSNGVQTSAPVVNASNNYWGSIDKNDVYAKLSGKVDADPWCNIDFSDCNYHFQFINTTTGVGYANLGEAINNAENGEHIDINNPGNSPGITVHKNVNVHNNSGGIFTINGASPALTVSAGKTASFTGVTFTTATNDPTILVRGGNLTLRNCTIIESTGAVNTGILVQDSSTYVGVLDAGTDNTINAGHNTFVTDGAGLAVTRTSTGAVNAIANYWGGITPSVVSSKISGTVYYTPWCNETFTMCGDDGSPYTYAPKLIRPLGTIVVPVKVTRFSDVTAISLRMGYDVSKLTYVSANLGPDVTGLTNPWFDAVGGEVVFTATASSPGLDLADNTVLINITFTYNVTGQANFTWIESDPSGTNLEYARPVSGTDVPYYDYQTATYYIQGYVTDGSLTFYRIYPDPLVYPLTATNQKIGATATGGSGTFTYAWVGPNGKQYSTQEINPDDGYGDYFVTASDGTATIDGFYHFDRVHNINSMLDYHDIQVAHDAVETDPDDIILADAGQYKECIISDKSLDIRGPNYLLSPNTDTRVPEAVIVPNISNPDPSTSSVVLFYMYSGASGTSIQGFTFDGDNPDLNSGVLMNGADVDAIEAISSYEGIASLNISHNIIKNLNYAGIDLYNYYNSGTPTTGNLVDDNKLDNIVPPIWGVGVIIYNNCYTDITNNVMTRVRLGIQTGNTYLPDPGNSRQIANNSIQANRRGIFHNNSYGTASPLTLSGNTITAYAYGSSTEWDGILFSASTITSNVSSNSINGAGISIPSQGYEIWDIASSSSPVIDGGSVSNVDIGVLADNYEGYNEDGPYGAYATINGVTITPKLTGVGIRLLDSPSSTSHGKINLTITGCNISGGLEGIKLEETMPGTVGGSLSSNTISASGIGIDVNSMVTSLTNGLSISGNDITITGQLAGTNPTTGIFLRKVTGDVAATITNNNIIGPFYGYMVYNLNTTSPTMILGGTISGVMQGLSTINVDPLNLITLAPSTFNVSGLSVSGFTGNYPALPNYNFHSGVYAFTGGTNLANKITLTVNNVTVNGTGKIQQDCAGLSFADFSSLAGMQDITVTACTIINNLNRGINVRAGADVEIATSTLDNNGGDPYGLGGNPGFGIISREGAVVNVHNNFITNPPSVISPYTVTAMFADGGIFTAFDNNLYNNSNPSGMLAIKSASGTFTATCNWWGLNSVSGVEGFIDGAVTYDPWLAIGTDAGGNPADGFQPVPNSCYGMEDLYVNDAFTTGDVYTGSTGLDAYGRGTQPLPYATITYAVDKAMEGSNIYIDAGTYQEQIQIGKTLNITGADTLRTIVKAPGTLTLIANGLSSENSPIIYVYDNTKNVNISNITVDGDGGRNVTRYIGVLYYEANGIFDNCVIKGIRKPTFDGSGHVAYYGGHTRQVNMTQNVTVSNCNIRDYGKGGIVIDAGLTHGTLTNNKIYGQNIAGVVAQNGIQLSRGAYGSISGNFVYNNIWNAVEHPHTWTAGGILLYGVGIDHLGAPTGLTTISDNTLNGNEVGLLSGYGTPYSSNLGVTYNPNTFANNKIHLWLDAAGDVNVGNIYDKYVLNTLVMPEAVFGCIQYAIDEATPAGGDILNASAGTFAENVAVHTPVTINGAGMASTTVIPSFSAPNTCSGASLCPTASNVFLVQASNITIQNLTVDGDNPDISTPSYTTDARNGIITDHLNFPSTIFNSLNVNNVTIKNIYLRGLYASTGGSFDFQNNIVDNVDGEANSIGIFNFYGAGLIKNNVVTNCNDGIASNYSSGTTYELNNVTNSGTGIHTDNNGGTGGIADVIRNNTISNSPVNGYGIFVFAPYKNVLVEKNTITNVEVGLTSAGSYSPSAIITFTQNTIDGQMKANSIGVYSTTEIWGYTSGNQNALFTNNFINNNVKGFLIASELGYTNTTTANENSITGNTTGIKLVKDYTEVPPTGAFVLDFNCNWWGSSDFAGVATAVGASNPPVDYAPWLTDGTDYGIPTPLPGFQPVPGSCSGNPMISGTLKYNNPAKTPMNGVTLALNTSPVTTATTDGTGNYTLTSDKIINGNYTITVTNNPKTPGSINSTDAAQVNSWATMSAPKTTIEYVKFLAGDVYGSGIMDPNYQITSPDAQHIQLRYVYGNTGLGLMDRGEWSYAKASDFVNANSNLGPIAVSVNNANLTGVNLYGQVTGDFNGSYLWSAFKGGSANVNLTYGDTKQIGAGVETDLPVHIVNASELSAVSLTFSIPTDKMEVLDVTMKENNGMLDWAVIGDELRFGWNSPLPLSFSAGEELLVIRLKTSDNFVQGETIRLDVTPDPINELADAKLEVIPGAELIIGVLESNSLGTPEQHQFESLTLASNPNPFASYTSLTYTLPSDGHVILTINDMTGRTVALLADEHQTIGKYTVKLDAIPLQPGVYTATIKLDTTGNDLVKTIKLVRQR